MRRYFPGYFKKSIQLLSSILLSMGVSSAALADDIDALTSGLGFTRPNILLVLDYSGSMDQDINGDETSVSGLPSRESILEAAVARMLDDNEHQINVGISIFEETASGIKWPVSDPSALAQTVDPSITNGNLTSKDVINSILSNTTANNATATVSALTEAALYFRGGAVSTGGISTLDPSKFEPQIWDSSQKQYVGGNNLSANPVTYSPANAYTPAPSETWTTPNYISPTTLECQSNFIVLVSDGQPTKNDSHPELASILGAPTSNCNDLSNSIFDESEVDSKDKGNCGPELVSALYDNDQVPGVDGSNIITYTVGFNVAGDGQDYLKHLVEGTEGQFFEANNPESLNTALKEVIDITLGESESFASLSIDVNKATFSNDNRVYFPLFRPSKSNAWQGNLKGYFIDSAGLKDTNGVDATVTENGQTRISDDAQSFWSPSVDGNDIKLGGASSLLPTTSRTIYTYTGGTLGVNGANLKTIDDSNLFDVNNGNISNGLLGVTSDTDRYDLINWLHGSKMGDPLHTRSVSVKYPDKTVVYLTTNQGLLHAIDATTPTADNVHTGGEELFAFIPPELLSNLDKLEKDEFTDSHIYGLDGGMTRWHDDSNNDGIVNGSDTVLLIFGMRRGGNHYYAIDVTNHADPIYKWKITGGTGSFPKLGQSWSKMSLINVMRNNDKESVLVFGGGYDTTLDGLTDRAVATGNSIYMVDRNGSLIWEASHADMDYSIPSDLTPIDSDNDGIADRIYFGDLGSQLWRVDFGDVASNTNFTITKLADLYDTNNQPFFYPPSVALNNTSGKNFLSVSIGSGYRSDPLYASAQNRLYMLKDTDAAVGVPTNGLSTATTANLYNATLDKVNSSNSTVATAAKVALNSARGWYINLEAGEKVLSKILTFEGKILATTFSPISAGSSDPCAMATSQNWYYALSLLNASPVDPLSDETDSNRELVTADRRKPISSHGISSEPIIVFDGSTASVVVDESVVDKIDQKLNKVMWHPK